jgi:hypothetical protein
MALVGGRDYGRQGSMDAQAHRRAHQGPTLSVEREVPACAPGNMLIDDLEKYRHLWISKGGPLDHSSLGSRNNPNAGGNGSARSFVFGSSIPTCRPGTVAGICAKNGKLNASFLANVNISEAIYFADPGPPGTALSQHKPPVCRPHRVRPPDAMISGPRQAAFINYVGAPAADG